MSSTKGFAFFHTYRENDFDEGPSDFYFTLSNESDEPEHHFDVRELTTYVAPQQPPFLTGANDTPQNLRKWNRHWSKRKVAAKAAILKAIDLRVLTQKEVCS